MLEPPEDSTNLSNDQTVGLATWALDVEPNDEELANTKGIRCLQLEPHRRDYLTYEGPVANNRGSVRQWTSGFYRRQHWSDDEIRVEFVSEKLNGNFRLLRVLENGSKTATENGVFKVWRLSKID